MLLGPEGALLLTRAAFVPGMGYAVKAETTIPANACRRLPTIQGAVQLFDAGTGGIAAIIDGRLVTEYKTAADSVLGASLLARPDSRHLLILGAETVARSLVRAYSAVFEGLERISIWSRLPEQAADLIAGMTGIKAELGHASDAETAAGSADIIATATGARAPILLGDWVRPATHVDLIGGYTPEMREADDALMSKASIHVYFLETTVGLCGDLTQPIAAGVISRGDVREDLYDLVSATSPARISPAEITVYKNGGGAHLDLMIASYIAQTMGARGQTR